jgi:Integrase core domain
VFYYDSLLMPRRFIQPLPSTPKAKKYYQYTAIDDCTRLRVLRAYPRCNQQTAIQFLDYVLQRLPFRVEVIQTDNGPEFGASFHWHVLDKGAGHVYIKPRTPRLNGKVERTHRIHAEFYRLLDGVVVDNAKVFNDKLREWEDFYNYHRPHGGLGGQTPYERLKQRTQVVLEEQGPRSTISILARDERGHCKERSSASTPHWQASPRSSRSSRSASQSACTACPTAPRGASASRWRAITCRDEPHDHGTEHRANGDARDRGNADDIVDKGMQVNQ